MTRLSWLYCIVLLALAQPAQAAEVIFPIGSRIGIAPPVGVAASQRFTGFEDSPHSVAIIMMALPPEAYPELEKSTAALEQQGATLERREELSLPVGKAFLVIARQEVENIRFRKWIVAAATPGLTAVVTFQIPDEARAAYPDDAIRAALVSLAVRQSVPVAEQLSLVPFKIVEQSGFRVGGVIAGRAVMLTDAAPDARSRPGAAQLVIAIAPGGPAQQSDRDVFARDLFVNIPNLKEVRIVSSEPLRIGGQQGHQIMARGKDATTGTDISIVQWIRFGTGAYMQFIGIARTETWNGAYARFRQVRDGIETP